MRLGKLKIFKERPGVISKGPVWVGFNGSYMYLNSSFLGLIYDMIKYHRDERFFVD